MELTLTLKIPLTALPFPVPLPLASLVEETALLQRALDLLVKSNNFPKVSRALLAEWIIEDGGVQLAQAISNRVAPRDGHILLGAYDGNDIGFANVVIEQYIRQGSTNTLIRKLVSRLQFGTPEITHAELDRQLPAAADAFGQTACGAVDGR